MCIDIDPFTCVVRSPSLVITFTVSFHSLTLSSRVVEPVRKPLVVCSLVVFTVLIHCVSLSVVREVTKNKKECKGRINKARAKRYSGSYTLIKFFPFFLFFNKKRAFSYTGLRNGRKVTGEREDIDDLARWLKAGRWWQEHGPPRTREIMMTWCNRKGRVHHSPKWSWWQSWEHSAAPCKS